VKQTPNVVTRKIPVATEECAELMRTAKATNRHNRFFHIYILHMSDDAIDPDARAVCTFCGCSAKLKTPILPDDSTIEEQAVLFKAFHGSCKMPEKIAAVFEIPGEKITLPEMTK
jgi:hypothetical protein